MKIQRVYITTTDGYINVITPDKIYRYEGIGCCPKQVVKWMKEHEITKNTTSTVFDD